MTFTETMSNTVKVTSVEMVSGYCYYTGEPGSFYVRDGEKLISIRKRVESIRVCVDGTFQAFILAVDGTWTIGKYNSAQVNGRLEGADGQELITHG